VLGAPHSGADLIGRALKQSPGFHCTIGQAAVQSVVYAFARSPSIQLGRRAAAATVLRDAFAQAWQVTAHCCLTCSPACRAGLPHGASSCVAGRAISRYADASPDLMYCADMLVDAFSDAKLVQVIRNGRDVAAAMLADPQALAWFKPGMANVETEFPNPFYGIETEEDRTAWPTLSAAGKCALRWRSSVRTMARLRSAMSAAQLTTVRYEDLVRAPAATARMLADFVGDTVAPFQLRREIQPRDEAWRKSLSPVELSDIEMVAGPDLIRVGYGALTATTSASTSIVDS
jgi:hypothetical protein